MPIRIRIKDRRGRCRWCGCTERRACAAGCSWANVQRTVCSGCFDLDRLIRNEAGRRQLAYALARGDGGELLPGD